MAPEVLYRVCHGSSTPAAWQKSLLTIQPAILHDYTRHRVRHCDYPAIIHSSSSPSMSSSSVRGTYVTGLTDGDVWRLDIFEGDQYERRRVRVRVLDIVGDEDGKGNVEGEEVETETYVWIDGVENLEEGEWDFGTFVREKMKRWIGRREEYDGESNPYIIGKSLSGTGFGLRLSKPSSWSAMLADPATDIDEAVRAVNRDPTGGRGMHGRITGELEETRGKDLLGGEV
jgi:hypothetical protein